MNLTAKARDLILRFEGISSVPDWPGGASGVTIGIGYDIGQNTAATFRSDWRDELKPENLKRLSAFAEIRGYSKLLEFGLFRPDESEGRVRGRAIKLLTDIRIAPESAFRVFDALTVPRYLSLARKAFPGFDALPADAQGALVSLVFNRGAAMGVRNTASWESRREMRAIQTAIGVAMLDMNGALEQIAEQIRSMKRLWVGKGLDGLLRRRDAEAALVESCVRVST